MNNQIIYMSSGTQGKYVIGLVFETIEEAQMLVKDKFPEAHLTRGIPYTVETDMFKIVWVPAYKDCCGQRLSYLFTTKEIEESEWFRATVRPMLTGR